MSEFEKQLASPLFAPLLLYCANALDWSLTINSQFVTWQATVLLLNTEHIQPCSISFATVSVRCMIHGTVPAYLRAAKMVRKKKKEEINKKKKKVFYLSSRWHTSYIKTVTG